LDLFRRIIFIADLLVDRTLAKALLDNLNLNFLGKSWLLVWLNIGIPQYSIHVITKCDQNTTNGNHECGHTLFQIKFDLDIQQTSFGSF
jgi:hypothetical protein